MIRESTVSSLKFARSVFKKKAAVSGEEWLTDNYYILENSATDALKGCRALRKKARNKDFLEKLVAKCIGLCKNGVLPKEEEIIEAFSGKASVLTAEYLPLCLTCALIDYAAKSLGKETNVKILANAVTSLRRMATVDFEYIGVSISKVEKILAKDPAGIYPRMDERTKSFYRKMIVNNAAKARISEEKFAERVLHKSQKSGKHIGEYIIPPKKQTKGRLMLLMQNIMPLLACFCFGVLSQKTLAAILLFFPLREVFSILIQATFLGRTQPSAMLRLRSDDEQIREKKVLITVSTILPKPENAAHFARHLEKVFLANRTKGTKTCCLADFKSAFSPEMPEDKVMLKAMRSAVEALNKKYSGGFILAVRPRVYSKTQDEFTGKERKMGAITALVKAVKGERKDFCEFFGDIQGIEETKYLLLLDSDTVPEFDAARELVAIAEHPLNRPVIDKKAGRVTSGYGIIVPAAVDKLDDETNSRFANLISDLNGGSIYSRLFSEKYHDLFGEAVFCGKGLIDVDAYSEFITDSLPSETILSHDIIESGFLRSGLASDIKVSESVPQSAKAYFQRLHRWVRGDWQNAGFIFGRNPLNSLSRYKLFDNLLRSLTKPICVITLIVSILLRDWSGTLIAAVCTAAIVLPETSGLLRLLMRSGVSALTRLYYSSACRPEAVSCIVRAFVTLSLAVHESFVSLDAIVKAIWRRYVTKKNMLEWVPAANTERNGSKLAELSACLPSVAVSALLLFFGLPFHRLVALIFLFDILFSVFSSSKPSDVRKKLSEGHRERLLGYAGAMWQYFDELCTKENNFLPPDNIQLAPVRVQAYRTSPTDIGMMLVSFLAARDLGFITSQELYLRLSLSFKSIEKLEKYKGNLLNWYDTKTLMPLGPVFVSSVDSGNFLCCLTALKEGLKEYVSECPSLTVIIAKALKIIKETDIGTLYCKQRGLFYTGVNPESGEASTSFYDLYMSESRLTSYFATAVRAVPKNHWSNLGRVTVSQGRYSGLVSWTGTMFEYFMPSLFLPSPKGSVSSESLYFCLHSQRKRAGKLPFGMSESGFYAFDSNLNYQYKAHGVQKLGLSRGLDKETVISPYSSFLTLAIAPNLSMANLERLEKMGLYGKYGFYEAVDFTHGRVKGNSEIVRSFMVHHLGMSITAAVNVLKSDCMQKRFMRDSRMMGAENLLFEKPDTSKTAFRDVKMFESVPKTEKSGYNLLVSRSPSILAPEATVFSNGRLALCTTDCASGHIVYDGIDLTVKSEDILCRPQGLFVVFKGEDFTLSNAPFLADKTAKNHTKLDKNKAEFISKNKNIVLKVTEGVLRDENCVIQRIKIENLSHKKEIKGRLYVYFEPCLSKTKDFAAHPAYSRLFINDRWDSENRCLVFSRNAKNKQESVSIAAGFKENLKSRYETSRLKVLTRPSGIFSLGKKQDFSGETGGADNCCAFKTEIVLASKGEYGAEFIVVAGESEKEAVYTLQKVKVKDKTVLSDSMFWGDNLEFATAKNIVPRLMYPKSFLKGFPLGEKEEIATEDLWSFGISGDLPIVVVRISQADEIRNMGAYVRVNKKLRMCGVPSDLVFVYSENDGYRTPVLKNVKKLLAEEKCELMFGVKGGIHCVNIAYSDTKKEQILLRAACLVVDNEKSNLQSEAETFRPLELVDSRISITESKNADAVKHYNFTQGKICIGKERETLDKPWCMVYANQSFGTLVSDKALGFTWALNSRQNKLTPWYNDELSDNRGEMIIVKNQGKLYDLAAISEVVFTPEKAIYNASCLSLDFKVSVQVPKRGMVKKITVEILNKSASTSDFDLMYFALPVLGVDRNETAFFDCDLLEKGVCVSRKSSDYEGSFALQCNTKTDYVCLSRTDFFQGKFDSKTMLPDDCCLAVGRKLSIAPGGKINMNFYLSWGAKKSAAERLPFCSDFSPKNMNPYVLQSKNEDLNLFFSSLLYSQVLQTRFYGKTGFSQCSGAYGFRDQLQDSLAFLDTEPEITRTHILRCASVQFFEGDVLHWWHVFLKSGQKICGVRTKCSDDLLWLPFVCCEYVKSTGDRGILDVKLPYIIGEELNAGEKERFMNPQRSKIRESLLEHCIKAAEKAANFGKNGLPLIGSCDWNDSFSNIGTENEGESVWLGMFMIIVFEQLSKICKENGRDDKTEFFINTAKELRRIIQEKFWNGDHYARAVLKDGTVLGKDIGFTDILPQAFSVFAGLENCEKAIETAYRELADEKSRVIRLLKPPFFTDDYEKIGYAALYPRGTRENGGQYTHAAVWLAMAFFNIGKREEGEKLLNLINPVGYYKTEKTKNLYLGEPYVLAGDVYHGRNYTSRAGWTHFTGSAGWFYRCVLENYSNELLPKFKKDKNRADFSRKAFDIDKL